MYELNPERNSENMPPFNHKSLKEKQLEQKVYKICQFFKCKNLILGCKNQVFNCKRLTWIKSHTKWSDEFLSSTVFFSLISQISHIFNKICHFDLKN